jgi:hypothetical protein
MKKVFKIENRYIKIYIQTDCTHIGYAQFIIYGLKRKYESIKQMNSSGVFLIPMESVASD